MVFIYFYPDTKVSKIKKIVKRYEFDIRHLNSSIHRVSLCAIRLYKTKDKNQHEN